MKKSSIILFLIIITAAFQGCQTRPGSVLTTGDDIYGLASPVKLKGDTTVIPSSDYFLQESIASIDSVSGDPTLRFLVSEDKESISVVSVSRYVPFISEMKVWISGTPYSFFVERDPRQVITFVFEPEERNYRNVAIRGEMTDWSPRPMVLMDGVWQIKLDLAPGRYQYLLVANGRDMLDPGNPVVVDNNIGGQNSLLTVGEYDTSKTPAFTAHSFEGYTINLRVRNEFDEVLVFWQNYRLPPENISRRGNTLSIHVPGEATQVERSHIRVRAYNPHGPSNDLLIPLEEGIPVNNPEQLTSEDKEATILYFMMVDRFENGNKENDEPVEDPEVAPIANFMGGDLAGIKQKIEEGYFRDLNINTIWFSPITQNPYEAYREYIEPQRKYTGYHGYWPITLTTVDYRFGTTEELRSLVETAHNNDMGVMLDFVSNHVHEENPLIKENPRWATPFILPDGRRNLRLWDEQRLTTWFDTFLPSLDFSYPQVVEIMADSAFYWMDEFDMDGFRHDATKHVPLDFWRSLTLKLKEDYMIVNNKRLFQIGETFGSRELIGSYVGSGLLDGQFDFNLYFDARNVFARQEPSFETLERSLFDSFRYYGYNNLMGNITGNHDMARFISLAGGALDFGEDHEEVGWQREVGVGDPVGYNRLSSLTAFIMTIPGVPVIYYGDEIGMPGGGDPDSRRMMRFDKLSEKEQWVKENAAKLAGIRANNLALIYGDFNTLHIDENTWAYSRNYFGDSAVILFNRSNVSETISIELTEDMALFDYQPNFGSGVSVDQNTMSVVLQPNSFEVLTSN